jgi:hypothetical protein
LETESLVFSCHRYNDQAFCLYLFSNWFFGCSQRILQKSFQDVKSRLCKDKFEEEDAGDEGSFGRIPFQIWNVSKFGSCADAAIVGLMPPPLLELQVTCLCIILLLLLDITLT